MTKAWDAQAGQTVDNPLPDKALFQYESAAAWPALFYCFFCCHTDPATLSWLCCSFPCIASSACTLESVQKAIQMKPCIGPSATSPPEPGQLSVCKSIPLAREACLGSSGIWTNHSHSLLSGPIKVLTQPRTLVPWEDHSTLFRGCAFPFVLSGQGGMVIKSSRAHQSFWWKKVWEKSFQTALTAPEPEEPAAPLHSYLMESAETGNDGICHA